MNINTVVSTADALISAIADIRVQAILLTESLADLPSLKLSPGQSLSGSHPAITLSFSADTDGLELSSDNRVHSLRLETSPAKRALFNDTTLASFGTLALSSLTAIGRVQILARDKVRAGHLEVNGLDIVSADARAETDRPHDYGVYVL